MRVAALGRDVLIVSAEGGDLDRRADAWIKHYAPGKTRAEFRIGVVERRLDMTDKETQDLIREQCAALALKPSLYVLDTYSKLRGRGSEENNNDDAKAFVDCIAQLRGKASALIVAHTAKGDPTKARGASALGDDTEAEFVVSKERDGIKVTRERFKQSPSLPPLHLRQETVDLGRVDSHGRAVTSLVLVECAGVKELMVPTRDRDGAEFGAVEAAVIEAAATTTTPLSAAGVIKAVRDGGSKAQPNSIRKAISRLSDVKVPAKHFLREHPEGMFTFIPVSPAQDWES
jgi:hypothetical protein